MMKKKETTLFLAAVVSHVFWGFSFLGTKSALSVVNDDLYLLLSHRFLIAFAIMNLLLLFRVVKVDFRGKWKRIWLPMLMGFMEPVVYFIGEELGVIHSTTIFSGVMIAVIPIVAIFAAIPFLHERPTVGQILFSFLSVGGVVGIGLLTRDSGRLDWIGVVGLIVAVLSAAAYGILDRGLSAEFTAFERTYLMIVMGAVFFAPIALVRTRFDLGTFFAPMGDPEFLLPVLFLSICCSVVSYFLLSYMATYMTVTRSTVYANLTTAVSVLAGALILKEPFSWLSAVFCVVILIGIYGVQRFARKDEPERIQLQTNQQRENEMRKDGRRVKTAQPMYQVAAHIMDQRCDSMNMMEIDVPLAPMQTYLNKKRAEGKEYSHLGLVLSAYVRTVAEYPIINRFVVNKTIYARNEIAVGMVVLKPGESEGTMNKMHFKPEFTIDDVHKTLETYVTENRASGDTNSTDDLIRKLLKVPGLCRFGVCVFKLMDKFGWLPKSIIDASPFHCSLTITNLASIRTNAIYHHVYNFGTTTMIMAMGIPREVPQRRKGEIVFEKCIPIGFVMDERVCSGSQYVIASRKLLNYLKHPELLETPPTEIVQDIP